MSDEKTEEPTEKKLEDARDKGQQPKSQDLTTALHFLGIALCLSFFSAQTLDRLASLVLRLIDQLEAPRSDVDLAIFFYRAMLETMLTLSPYVGFAVLFGLIGSASQVGLNVTLEPLEPNFDKLNPAEGLKKLVSVKSLVEFVKTLVKAVAVIWVLWLVIEGLTDVLLGAAYLQPAQIALLGWDAVLKTIAGAALVYLVLAPIDFGLQLWLFLRDQKMSKDEIKRERKESDGDPQLKGKRKQLAREYATTASERTVPGASVVVTNPTHYAVALLYAPPAMSLPTIVAKGVDAEAKRIREIAQANGIPIVGEPPLARALHALPQGAAIPEELFDAVVAVLRWVDSLRALGAIVKPRPGGRA